MTTTNRIKEITEELKVITGDARHLQASYQQQV